VYREILTALELLALLFELGRLSATESDPDAARRVGWHIRTLGFESSMAKGDFLHPACLRGDSNCNARLAQSSRWLEHIRQCETTQIIAYTKARYLNGFIDISILWKGELY
jgi:hypothetical protein